MTRAESVRVVWNRVAILLANDALALGVPEADTDQMRSALATVRQIAARLALPEDQRHAGQKARREHGGRRA